MPNGVAFLRKLETKMKRTKSALGVFAIKCAMVIGTVVIAASIGLPGGEESLKFNVTNLSEAYLTTQEEIQDEIGLGTLATDIKESGNSVFVLDFVGSVYAEEVAQLSEEISAVLSVAKEGDTVIVKVDTGGGVVNGYGLGMSQLERIKDAKLELVVAVDKVAASGGYLMATVADKVVAAPFAYVGSIGVVASLPNFHEVMEKIGVGYEVYTAGESKRNVGIFKENTKEDVEKLNAQLIRIHDSFKGAVSKYRPQVNIDAVATGDFWLAKDAVTLGLVDELATSNELIEQRILDGDTVVLVEKNVEKSLTESLIRDLIGAIKSSTVRSDLI